MSELPLLRPVPCGANATLRDYMPWDSYKITDDLVMQALRSPSAVVKVFDAHGMPAAQIASQLEANALEQHCAAARSVPSETYAAVRTMLPGVQYHAGSSPDPLGAFVPEA